MAGVGFVGGGNMAEAIIKGIISAELFQPGDVCVSDIKPDRLNMLADRYGVSTFADNAELAEKINILILSVKPSTTAAALESIKNSMRSDSLLISIVAGKKVENITAVLGETAVARVMPNTPALIGQGASAVYTNDKARPRIDTVRRIFLCIGQCLTVEQEDLIDAVTAVSGSGPAYFYLLIDEMIKAGVQLGLTQEAAETLVLQTAKGAAMLAQQAREQGETPADLTKKVATPGGTTEAAINTFRDGNFGAMVGAALQAARDRSRELSGM